MGVRRKGGDCNEVIQSKTSSGMNFMQLASQRIERFLIDCGTI